jgi:hypothetical protein
MRYNTEQTGITLKNTVTLYKRLTYTASFSKKDCYFLPFNFFSKKGGVNSGFQSKKKPRFTFKKKTLTSSAVFFKDIRNKIKLTPVNSLNRFSAIRNKSNTKSQAISFKLFSNLNGDPFVQFKSLINLITNSRFSFYSVNAISLTRYSFDQESHNTNKKIKSFKIKQSQHFLQSLEREILGRFRYVAIFIKDLIRVSFFCRYLKKAIFIAQFYAFTLQKLPRNRKETQFIRFLNKLIKVVSSQREERLGLRLQIKGRLNR